MEPLAVATATRKLDHHTCAAVGSNKINIEEKNRQRKRDYEAHETERKQWTQLTGYSLSRFHILF